MRLSRLTLHNFGGYRDASIELTNPTVIVGPNNAGKTTLINAIDWLNGSLPSTYETIANDDARSHDEPVWVLGEFTDLGDTIDTPIGRLSVGERVRFGRHATKGGGWGGVHLVRPAGESEVREGGRPPITIGDDVWLPFYEYDDSLSPSTILDSARLSGPERPLEAVEALLRPILKRRLREIMSAHPEAWGETNKLLDIIEPAQHSFAEAFRRFAPQAGRAHLQPIENIDPFDPLLDALIAGWSVTISDEHEEPADGARVIEHAPLPATSRDVGRFGAGTQRAAALAALSLYTDQSVWPPDASVLILLEEPEVGLHPAAERKLLAALRTLPTYGVQLIIVSHSPMLINGFGMTAVQLATTSTYLEMEGERPVVRRIHEITALHELRQAAELLGARPADVLLARGFLVVEGPVDAIVIAAWALTLGASLKDAGVEVVNAGGHNKTPMISELLRVAYPGVDVEVWLDSGSHTADTRADIMERFGDRVRVELLPRTDIEGFFSAAAIERWLQALGAGDHAEELARAIADSQKVKPALRKAAMDLGHTYDPMVDAAAIAGFMAEHEIDPIVRGHISRLADSAVSMD